MIRARRDLDERGLPARHGACEHEQGVEGAGRERRREVGGEVGTQWLLGGAASRVVPSLVALGTVEGERVQFGGALVLLRLNVRGRRGGYVEERRPPLRQPLHADAVRVTIGDEIDEGVGSELGTPIRGKKLAVFLKLFLYLQLPLGMKDKRENGLECDVRAPHR